MHPCSSPRNEKTTQKDPRGIIPEVAAALNPPAISRTIAHLNGELTAHSRRNRLPDRCFPWNYHEEFAIRNAVAIYALRLSNRIPEALAALCFAAGFVVCAFILKR